jgi:hypothetical protein
VSASSAASVSTPTCEIRSHSVTAHTHATTHLTLTAQRQPPPCAKCLCRRARAYRDAAGPSSTRSPVECEWHAHTTSNTRHVSHVFDDRRHAGVAERVAAELETNLRHEITRISATSTRAHPVVAYGDHRRDRACRLLAELVVAQRERCQLRAQPHTLSTRTHTTNNNTSTAQSRTVRHPASARASSFIAATPIALPSRPRCVRRLWSTTKCSSRRAPSAPSAQCCVTRTHTSIVTYTHTSLNTRAHAHAHVHQVSTNAVCRAVRTPSRRSVQRAA